MSGAVRVTPPALFMILRVKADWDKSRHGDLGRKALRDYGLRDLGATELEDSVFFECRFRRHSFFKCFAHGLFLASFLQCETENLLLGQAGDDTNSVEIAEDDVSGRNACLANLNRHPEIDHLAARALVLRVAAAGKKRKAKSQHAAGVARVAID